METAFEAIGLEISSKKAIANLASDVERRGEISLLAKKEGILHGRCWRIGEGLEVWQVLYRTKTGEIYHTDCRPGFRARYYQRVNPWMMTEFDRSGEAMIHGFIEDTETEVLFELQNITEVSEKNFQNNTLQVGLGGLAFQAEVFPGKKQKIWGSNNQQENIWHLCGEIVCFDALRNPLTGNDLFWLLINLGNFELEILVNQKSLRGSGLNLGATFSADVWLQGHIVSESTKFLSYEGVDYTRRTVDFWKKLKRLN